MLVRNGESGTKMSNLPFSAGKSQFEYRIMWELKAVVLNLSWGFQRREQSWMMSIQVK